MFSSILFLRKRMKVRKSLRGKEILWYESKVYLFFGLIPVPFSSRKWKPLNNTSRALEAKLRDKVQEVMSIHADWLKEKDRLAREISNMGGKDETEWFTYPLGRSESYRHKKLLEKVNEKDWKPFLSTRLGGNPKNIKQETREAAGAPSRGNMPSSDSTAYILDDLDLNAFNISMIDGGDGITNTMKYREPKDNGGGNNSKNWKKKKPDEDQAEYETRMRLGKNHPDHPDYQG